jgi:LysM repeat protein
MVKKNLVNQKVIFILELALIFSFFSCKTYKPVASKSGSGVAAKDYINKYKDLAVSEMKRTGIPASITLAQGMIESDFGRSRLATEGNNHFGIKCHDDWRGQTIRHNDDKRNECFRKYKNPEESFYDHSDFLKSESRYSTLFKISPTDYKSWARGLKRTGYATNPDYANMLVRKIEENNLYYFDRVEIASANLSQSEPVKKDSAAIHESDKVETAATVYDGNTSVPAVLPRIKENNRIQYIIVRDGDTKEKLDKDFQLLKWELAKYNEINGDIILIPGQILYLQPKRDKAEPGKEFYNSIEGDTMYIISQKYGIKLKKLYEMNRMEEGQEPVAGQKIWLRVNKPVN